MMIKSESIMIAAGFAGLLAGALIGYKIGQRKNQHHYLYEFEDVEDYGDEEEDYDVFSADQLTNIDEPLDDFRPVMKAEPAGYEID